MSCKCRQVFRLVCTTPDCGWGSTTNHRNKVREQAQEHIGYHIGDTGDFEYPNQEHTVVVRQELHYFEPDDRVTGLEDNCDA